MMNLSSDDLLLLVKFRASKAIEIKIIQSLNSYTSQTESNKVGEEEVTYIIYPCRVKFHHRRFQ